MLFSRKPASAPPFRGYLEGGCNYPIGTSQKISDALAGIVRKNGGEVKLSAHVEMILTNNQAAYGVRTSDGTEPSGRAIVSDANAIDTLTRLMDERGVFKAAFERIDEFSFSYSTFLVWLGLKRELVGEVGLKDSEIFCYPDYDSEAEYGAVVAGGLPADPGFGLTV